MDLVSNPEQTKVVVATEHVAKDGSSKIVQECALPLTGARVVSTIITDLVSQNAPHSAECYSNTLQCVFEVDRENGGLTLTELAPGVDVEEVRSKTDASFAVASQLKAMN